MAEIHGRVDLRESDHCPVPSRIRYPVGNTGRPVVGVRQRTKVPALARTRTRGSFTEADELRRWREGLETALHAPPRKRRRAVRGVAIVLVLVVILGIAGGYYYWHTISGLFQRTSLSLSQPAGGAMNIVIVGSDSRAGLTDPADVNRFGTVGGRRSDTLIVAQIIPSQKRGVLVSIPRDTWVTVHHNGRTFEGKINSAYTYGPQAVIDTVYALTGLPINHYIDVNFLGFQKMVNALGGIDICNAQSFDDTVIGFSLTKGPHHLNGLDALQYVRTRHATADGDFGRIKRQQEFLRAVMAKVGRPAVLGNPLTINRLATAFAQNVTVDQYFKLADLIRLAVSFKRIGQNQLETFSVPSRVGNISGQSVVFVNESQAEPLFSALRQIRDPRTVLAPSTNAPPAPAARTATGTAAPATHAAAPACPT
jgi:LCP family protein required for cell wall assembly